MFDIEGWTYRFFEEVGRYGNPTTDLNVQCPFCQDRIGKEDTKHHLHISLTKNAAHCFRCGYGAGWIRLVIDVTGYPYHRAIGELYVRPNMRQFQTMISGLTGDDYDIPAYDVELPDGFMCLASKSAKDRNARLARKYLKSRGYGEYHWKRYNLGVADSTPGRVIIPVENAYWQARRLYDWMEPKYLNPKNPARNTLFNAVALTIYEEVVVAEGAFSAMSIGDNAIALIGKEATDEKVARMVDSDVKKFIVALDSDARKHALMLADKLYKRGKDNIEIWRYDDGDPAENNGIVSRTNYDLKTRISGLLGK